MGAYQRVLFLKKLVLVLVDALINCKRQTNEAPMWFAKFECILADGVTTQFSELFHVYFIWHLFIKICSEKQPRAGKMTPGKITNENYQPSKSHICTHNLSTELNYDDLFCLMDLEHQPIHITHLLLYINV